MTTSDRNTEGISPCCLSGHLHTGTPTGKDETIGGIKAYVADGGQKGTILVITDIFGYELSNVRLVADEFATVGGYKVIIPDVFAGDYVPVAHMKALIPLSSDPEKSKEQAEADKGIAFGDVGPWLGRQSDDKVRPRFEAVLDTVKGDGPVGVLGFCWGGTQALHYSTVTGVKAVVADHPSFADFPGLFQAVKCPTLIQVGTNDSMFPDDQVHEVESIFKSKSGSSVKIYPGAIHGFGCRGDLNNTEEKKVQDDATVAGLEFFKAYLK